MSEQKVKLKIDPRLYYVLGILLVGVAAVSASSVPVFKSPQLPLEEQPLISSNVVEINADELKELRTMEADEVFTLISSMEKGYIKAGDVKEKIQDYKYNAQDFSSANTVEAGVNQAFISFCNSAIDCTNAYYYGVESEEYKKVYGEMKDKKELI